MLHRLSLLLLLLCSAIVAPATLTVYDMKAWGIRRDPFGNGYVYVKVYYNNSNMRTTQVKKNTTNPVWTESFSYGNAALGRQLKLKVYDKKVQHDDLLGTCVTNIMFGEHQYTCELIRAGLLEYRYNLQ